jgi:hypothetical protein
MKEVQNHIVPESECYNHMTAYGLRLGRMAAQRTIGGDHGTNGHVIDPIDLIGRRLSAWDLVDSGDLKDARVLYIQRYFLIR